MQSLLCWGSGEERTFWLFFKFFLCIFARNLVPGKLQIIKRVASQHAAKCSLFGAPIHSDCFCKQMLQILLLIKYQGLDSNPGPCQQKTAQILAPGPRPTKGWLWTPETLAGSLPLWADLPDSRMWCEESGFWGVSRVSGRSAVQAAAWQHGFCVLWRAALQPGWRAPLRHTVNNHRYQSVTTSNEDTGAKEGRTVKLSTCQN